jgi:hypothetical protein
VVEFLSAQDRLVTSILAADGSSSAAMIELHALSSVIARLGLHARALSDRVRPSLSLSVSLSLSLTLQQYGAYGPVLLRLREAAHKQLQRFVHSATNPSSLNSESHRLTTAIAQNALVYLRALAEEGGIVFAPTMASDRTDLVHGAAIGLLADVVRLALHELADNGSASRRQVTALSCTWFSVCDFSDFCFCGC